MQPLEFRDHPMGRPAEGTPGGGDHGAALRAIEQARTDGTSRAFRRVLAAVSESRIASQAAVIVPSSSTAAKSLRSSGSIL
jgi:hypothetical protein